MTSWREDPLRVDSFSLSLSPGKYLGKPSHLICFSDRAGETRGFCQGEESLAFEPENDWTWHFCLREMSTMTYPLLTVPVDGEYFPNWGFLHRLIARPPGDLECTSCVQGGK
jgi:hypothetical protein